MNLQNLLNQFAGSHLNQNTSSSIGHGLGQLTNKIPGGIAGGAAAGGMMALLMSNKKARKFAGKAATVGGAALLGGLAYTAYKNWQANGQTGGAAAISGQLPNEQAMQNPSADFQLTLVKAMIAAAKADGHIDAEEQQRIFDAVDQMALDNEVKGVVFDLLRQPIGIAELTVGLDNLEQKSEVYLASCLAINPDHPSEKAFLQALAQALALPTSLAEQIQFQAQQAFDE